MNDESRLIRGWQNDIDTSPNELKYFRLWIHNKKVNQRRIRKERDINYPF